MNRILVDTSGWIAYLRARDPLHPAVREAADRWEGRLVTTNFIFDEAITLAMSRADHAFARRVGEYLRDSGVTELVRVTSDDEEAAWAWFCRDSDKDYSYTDCVSFAVMRRLGIDRAITLDRHFRQAGFTAEPESHLGWELSEGTRSYALATPRAARDGRVVPVQRPRAATKRRIARP